MKRKILINVITLLISISGFAQKDITITVTNNSKISRVNEPIVLNLKDFSSNIVKSALVRYEGKEIPCQLDDVDQDGIMDELCFITDIEKKSSKKINITLYDKGKPKEYAAKVYAEMLLSNKKVKESNKQNLYISHLTVNRGVNPYSSLHHHGVAFENEMVAYRIYFDHRQTIDIYGKYNKGLELEQTQFYPDEKQKKQGFGDDVLWVGSTFGLGALRGWDGKQPTMLTDVEKRSQRIISQGPLRTIIEVKDMEWRPQPDQEPIDMTILYILYAGKRECHVKATFNKNIDSYKFSTGIINVKNSEEFSDKDGVRGCWGTDWTVSEKDSAGHKRETVGLGIYIPKKYIISEEPANKDNYAFIIGSKTNEICYKITFCSDNEKFGYHKANEWFDYLKEWKKEQEYPITISK